MKNASSRRPLLQWTFHRAGRYITCQLIHAGRTFRLSLQALSPESAPQMTTFASGIQAMQRHAEIARALRAAGWAVAAYTDAPAAPHRGAA